MIWYERTDSRAISSRTASVILVNCWSGTRKNWAIRGQPSGCGAGAGLAETHSHGRHVRGQPAHRLPQGRSQGRPKGCLPHRRAVPSGGEGGTGTLRKTLLQWDYTRVEDALFALCALDDYSEAFLSLRPRIVRLLSTERTLPIEGNTGLLAWFSSNTVRIYWPAAKRTTPCCAPSSASWKPMCVPTTVPGPSCGRPGIRLKRSFWQTRGWCGNRGPAITGCPKIPSPPKNWRPLTSPPV